MKSRKGRGISAEELCSIAADSSCGLFDADVFHPDMTFKVKWALKTSHSLTGGVWSELANILTSCILHPLQLVKGVSAPRNPDCFQKVPKKVNVAENGQVLAVSVDCDSECSLCLY